MEIVYNQKKDYGKGKLKDLKESLNDIQDLINSHRPENNENIVDEKKNQSYLKTLIDLFRSIKNRKNQFVLLSAIKNNEYE